MMAIRFFGKLWNYISYPCTVHHQKLCAYWWSDSHFLLQCRLKEIGIFRIRQSLYGGGEIGFTNIQKESMTNSCLNQRISLFFTQALFFCKIGLHYEISDISIGKQPRAYKNFIVGPVGGPISRLLQCREHNSLTDSHFLPITFSRSSSIDDVTGELGDPNFCHWQSFIRFRKMSLFSYSHFLRWKDWCEH